MAAVKFAEQSSQPPLEKLYDYTYADGAVEPGCHRPAEPAHERREGAPSPNANQP